MPAMKEKKDELSRSVMTMKENELDPLLLTSDDDDRLFKSRIENSLVTPKLLPNLKAVTADKTKCKALGIDGETRRRMKILEYYHYLTIQIRWNAIGNLLLAIFELLILVLCLFSMDFSGVFGFEPGPFIS